MQLLTSLKHVLTKVGQKTTTGQLRQLQASVNYLWTGHWMAQQGFAVSKRVGSREAVWQAAIDRLKSPRILYLEFGVAGGKSIRFWSLRVPSPDAMFHGFDSFEGLPEKSGIWTKGQFSTNGAVPNFSDSRVHFHKGWFNETLPQFEVPPHDVLIVNMDADLYSSTIYVLRQLKPQMRKGTLIYFDELNHPEHEQRAFEEFMQESGLKFKVLAAERTLAFVMFECLGLSSPSNQRTA